MLDDDAVKINGILIGIIVGKICTAYNQKTLLVILHRIIEEGGEAAARGGVLGTHDKGYYLEILKDRLQEGDLDFERMLPLVDPRISPHDATFPENGLSRFLVNRDYTERCLVPSRFLKGSSRKKGFVARRNHDDRVIDCVRNCLVSVSGDRSGIDVAGMGRNKTNDTLCRARRFYRLQICFDFALKCPRFGGVKAATYRRFPNGIHALIPLKASIATQESHCQCGVRALLLGTRERVSVRPLRTRRQRVYIEIYRANRLRE
jgi:hypothetical protein